jgi:hypothetical protein
LIVLLDMTHKERPIIEIDVSAANKLETFQSLTLRPILKMQNTLFLQTFRQYALEKKVEIETLKPEKLEIYINTSLRKDLWLKSFLIGVVFGQFSEQEAAFFYNNKSELSKRIVTMLIERLRSQLCK